MLRTAKRALSAGLVKNYIILERVIKKNVNK
jgi:hypothetical protein